MIAFNVSNGASPGDSLARSNGSCRCVHFHSIFNILNVLFRLTVYLRSNLDFPHGLQRIIYPHKV